ncbi:MAG: hypothetical protein LC128_09350 [Chitinophagales bacterium]|nr:hypothetical protein [Chitinophagales bacterium]
MKMYDLEKLRFSNDLLQIAEQAGAEFHKVSANDYRSHCPLHGGDNKSAFTIYLDGGVQKYKCFTRQECGTGDVIDFVQKWLNISFNDACEWLGGEKQLNQADKDRIIKNRAIREIQRLEEATNKALQVLEELRQTETWRKYHETVEQNENYQQLWESEGIPIEWQNYWWLGYCNQFTVMTDIGKWTTPTMTIPIFTGTNWELQNIKHRLINPYKQNDKYRPERPGLQASPFFCSPDDMFDAEKIIIVEGEKKAMVTYLTLEDNDYQVIGLPGKNQWRNIVDKFHGQSAYVWLDPDAYADALEFSKLIGARLININMKVDDAINDGILTKRGIRNLLSTSRKPRA